MKRQDFLKIALLSPLAVVALPVEKTITIKKAVTPGPSTYLADLANEWSLSEEFMKIRFKQIEANKKEYAKFIDSFYKEMMKATGLNL